ncbi:hypothetical protein GQ600_20797 [Phytophthora cactorum]|nr:hypothetical protein GQ600_20797 [Phytophthora cactorum]
MQKLAQKSDRSLRKRGSSSNRIALLSTATMSDCSTTSDQEILAELWAMHSPSMDRASDEDMPAIDEEMADTTPMEFLFFMGSDDMNLFGDMTSGLINGFSLMATLDDDWLQAIYDCRDALQFDSRVRVLSQDYIVL